MPIFLIPILIIIGIFAVSAGGDILKNIDIPFLSFQFAPKERTEKPAPTIVSPQPSATKRVPSTSTISASFLLDTIITKGPTKDTEITDTNIVTFEFEGSVTPKDTTGRITFETKINGIDSDWKTTSSKQRTMTLPTQQSEYIFLVRAKLDNIVDTTPAQSTFKLAVSPFFGKVDIASARESSSNRSSQITLRPKINAGETLDITGWKIVGRNGSFTIPLGIEQFEPGLRDTPINPIILTKADTVKLSSEKSPFGLKRNFRPNICMGYLKDSYDFDLSFSASCSFQKPLASELLYLPGQCADFILKRINFSSCRVPEYPDSITILEEVTGECADYLEENFTYHACFENNKDESNFTKNEWHIYMNTDFIDPRYDLLKLYDTNGLLIDQREML
jgi:hypothetical protein